MFRESDLVPSALPLPSASPAPPEDSFAVSSDPGWLVLADRYVAEAEAERVARLRSARVRRFQLAMQRSPYVLYGLAKRRPLGAQRGRARPRHRLGYYALPR